MLIRRAPDLRRRADDRERHRQLISDIRAAGAQRIAIERPSGLIVDALVEAGFGEEI